MSARPVALRPVLIADDDRLSRKLTHRLLDDMNVDNPIVETADGDEVIAYLERAVAGDADVPALLILDENMPGHTGRAILRWRKTRTAISDVPVLLVTGALIGADIDVLLGAALLVKPVSISQFEQAVGQFDLTG